MTRERTWTRGKDSTCSGSESSFEVTTSESPDMIVKTSVPGEWGMSVVSVSHRMCLVAGSEYQIQSIYPGQGSKSRSSSSSATLPRQLNR